MTLQRAFHSKAFNTDGPRKNCWRQSLMLWKSENYLWFPVHGLTGRVVLCTISDVDDTGTNCSEHTTEISPERMPSFGYSTQLVCSIIKSLHYDGAMKEKGVWESVGIWRMEQKERLLSVCYESCGSVPYFQTDAWYSRICARKGNDGFSDVSFWTSHEVVTTPQCVWEKHTQMRAHTNAYLYPPHTVVRVID